MILISRGGSHTESDPSQADSTRPQIRWGLCLALVLAIGCLVRLSYVLASDFPLHDGGLFLVMMQDLQHAGYVLPQHTSYNGGDIPFAYPPFGFYAGALLEDITPLSYMDVLRFLPVIVNALTVGAFVLFARSYLRDDAERFGAGFAFALAQGTFVWWIMGGGLTRSFGFLFAVLTLWQLHLLLTSGRRGRQVLLAGLFGGLTVLSHMEGAYFLLVSAAVMLLFFGRDRTGVLVSAEAGLLATAISAPWWLSVMLRDGFTAILTVGNSRPFFGIDAIATRLRFDITNERLVPVLALLALLGLVVCAVRRDWFLPAWLGAVWLLVPWIMPRVGALPVALMAGIGFGQVLLPLLERTHSLVDRSSGGNSTRVSPRAPLPAIVLGIVILYVSIGGFMVGPGLLVGLPVPDREAMTWVRENTSQDDRFLIVTGQTWGIDDVSEWFPALAQRQSVATPHGREWDTSVTFSTIVDRYDNLQECGDLDARCLDDWTRESGLDFEYVYIAKRKLFHVNSPRLEGCCSALRADLRESPDYVLVYDGPGASVYEKIH